MRCKRIILITLILIIALTGCKGNKDNIQDPDINKPIDEHVKEEEDIQQDEIVKIDPIEEKIKSMSLDEKIGQLIIIGFDGTNITEDIIKTIENLKVGGFILFSRNLVDENQSLKLLNDLKEANLSNDIPLFLSIDEEGGTVSRLPKSFTRLPSAAKVGNKEDKEISYRFGRILGERVKSLGFNMNFAPVLDINSNPNNPVIGNRAFGSTVGSVVDSGISVMLGIREAGLIPVVKHFPGHGDTDVDSHISLPKVDKDIDELDSFEIVPFKEAISEDVDMVMVGHILYPSIDNELPATMSEKIIQGILREKLGYEGVVVSDDMTMGAIVNKYSLELGVLSFIKAGGDIGLVCHGNDTPEKVINKLIEAVEDGSLSEDDIDKKIYRILKLKEKYKLKDEKIEEIDINSLNEETKELINQINR